MDPRRIPGWFMELDQDEVNAACDLVGRTGATELTVGYLYDDVPVEDAGWYAHAQYRGARVIVEDKVGPTEALMALARRLLDGAQCAHCGKEVSLRDGVGCRWRREGDKWKRGCE